MEASYISVDIETTGLDPRCDKIIEIGAIKVINGEIAESYETYVNPGRTLPEKITELTGIREEQVQEAPYIQDVMPEFLEFAGDGILLGHHVIFDYSFLKRAAVNEKLEFERQGLDTLKMARIFLPELESRSLPYLCKYFEIPHVAHRALEDARATHRLYRILCERYPAEDTFHPTPLIYKVKRESPITPRQKSRLYSLIDKHKLKVEYDVERLTKNEASRFTDKILAQYGR